VIGEGKNGIFKKPRRGKRRAGAREEGWNRERREENTVLEHGRDRKQG